jgi:hypothetical protein
MSTLCGVPDMNRSGDFLFWRNRVTVAVSRARCLLYLV